MLDAPPTGRIVRFLNVNARWPTSPGWGRSARQAESITRMLRDRRPQCTWSRCSRRCRCRRPSTRSRELSDAGLPVGRRHRQPGARAARSTAGDARDRRGRRRRVAAAGSTDDLKAVGVRTSAGDRRRPAAPRRRPRRAGRARAAEQRGASQASPTAYAAPAARAASRTAASRCSPTRSPTRGCADGARSSGTAHRRRPRTSTSTRCWPTRRPGSSSAAAPAASARPRRPRRSGCARPRRGRRVVVLTIDPARRLAQSLGLDRARQHPAAGGRRRRRRPAASLTR